MRGGDWGLRFIDQGLGVRELKVRMRDEGPGTMDQGSDISSWCAGIRISGIGRIRTSRFSINNSFSLRNSAQGVDVPHE